MSAPLTTSASASTDPQRPETRVAVAKPRANTVTVVDAQPGAEIAFQFDLNGLAIKVVDVDLIIVFPDGARIVLPGLAFDIVSNNAPKISFAGSDLSHNDLVALLPNVQLSQAPAIQVITSQSTDESGLDAPTQPTAQTPEQLLEASKLETRRHATSDESLLEAIRAPAIPVKSAASTTTSGFENPFTDYGNDKVAVLKIDLLGDPVQSRTAISSTLNQIDGAFAHASAATDKSFTAQSAREIITGSSVSDIIYADPLANLSAGSTTRILDVQGTMPSPSLVATTALISGLPDGFAITNGIRSGSGYMVALDKDDPNHIQLALSYPVPADGTLPDTDGYYSKFTLTVTYFIENGSQTIKATGSQLMAIGDPTSDGTMVVKEAGSDKTTLVLFATPPGNIVSAGDGDDTIHSGLGTDNINGGSGTDIVSYAHSRSGVSVDLQSGTGAGGYARGDTLSSIEGIVGSAYADTMRGTAGDNYLVGGAGNDAIDGRDGIDTVDYNGSTAAITVDLLTGLGYGGHAQGDSLTSIENLIGSAYADSLVGNAAANQIFGGDGNDTFLYTLGHGSDTVVGGAGSLDILELFTTASHYARGNAQGAGVDFVVAIGGTTYTAAGVADGAGGWNLDLVWGANTSGTVTFSDGGTIAIDNTLERIHW